MFRFVEKIYMYKHAEVMSSTIILSNYKYIMSGVL